MYNQFILYNKYTNYAFYRKTNVVKLLKNTFVLIHKDNNIVVNAILMQFV